MGSTDFLQKRTQSLQCLPLLAREVIRLTKYVTPKIISHLWRQIVVWWSSEILWLLWVLTLRLRLHYIAYWRTQNKCVILLQVNMEQRDLTDICSHWQPERRELHFTITTTFNGLSHTRPPVALRPVGVDGAWIKEQQDVQQTQSTLRWIVCKSYSNHSKMLNVKTSTVKVNCCIVFHKIMICG